jgi:hypothetical protein
MIPPGIWHKTNATKFPVERYVNPEFTQHEKLLDSGFTLHHAIRFFKVKRKT